MEGRNKREKNDVENWWQKRQKKVVFVLLKQKGRICSPKLETCFFFFLYVLRIARGLWGSGVLVSLSSGTNLGRHSNCRSKSTCSRTLQDTILIVSQCCLFSLYSTMSKLECTATPQPLDINAIWPLIKTDARTANNVGSEWHIYSRGT